MSEGQDRAVQTGAALVLRTLQRAQREAVAAARASLGEVEKKSISTWLDFYNRLRKKIDENLGRMTEAKKKSDDHAGIFRTKLMSGPVTEEEFRARTVMLEMEYESRLKIAEQGFEVLARTLEDYSDGEQDRLREVCDRLEDALRLKVDLSHKDLIEPIERRDRELRSAAEDLAAVRESAGRLESENKRLSAELEFLGREKEREVRRLSVELDRAKKAAGGDSGIEKELEAALVENSALRNKNDEDRRLHQERISQLQVVIDRAWEKISELEKARASLADLEAKAEAAGQEMQRLNVRRNRAEEERDLARAEETRLERQLFDAREEVLVLRDKVDAANAQSAELRRECEARKAASQESEKELEMMREDARRDREKSAELTRRMSELREKLEHIRAAKPSPAVIDESPGTTSDELGRARAEIDRLSGELEAARRALGRKSGEDRSAMAKETEALRKMLREAEDAKAAAGAERDKARGALEEQKSRIRELQKAYLSADVGRDRMKAEREETWGAEKEDYEERLSQSVRDINTLRATLQESQRAWEESFAKQDAMRMKEIFRLKAEVERLTSENELLKKRGSG